MLRLLKQVRFNYPEGKNVLFSDEGGKASDGNLIYFIRNDYDKDRNTLSNTL